METQVRGPALIDGTVVAGVSIPPGTGSFMRPASRFAPAVPALAEPALMTHGETAPEIAKAGPLTAESSPAVVQPAPEAAPASEPATAPTEPAVPTFTAPHTDVRPLVWPLSSCGNLYEAIVVSRPSR